MRRVSRLVVPINATMQSSMRRQTADVDGYFDKLVRQAEAASGGSAAGDEEFLEGYRFLLRQVAKVRTMSPSAGPVSPPTSRAA
nr:hypothetical protein GCM10025732_04290 [Glycomyces mayteni]